MSYNFNVSDLGDKVQDIWSDKLDDYMNQFNIDSIDSMSCSELASIEIETLKECHETGINDKKSFKILLESIKSALDI